MNFLWSVCRSAHLTQSPRLFSNLYPHLPSPQSPLLKPPPYSMPDPLGPLPVSNVPVSLPASPVSPKVEEACLSRKFLIARVPRRLSTRQGGSERLGGYVMSGLLLFSFCPRNMKNKLVRLFPAAMKTLQPLLAKGLDTNTAITGPNTNHEESHSGCLRRLR